MKRLPLAIVVAALLSMPLAAARAAEVPIPPAPARWATDTAGFLSASALQRTDRALEQFERETGNQVLVWIGKTTGDDPLEDWTVRTFAAWKVGRKGLDNGLVLFVFADDRAVRIEVGYGLEDRVPDAIASRIIRDDIIPKLQSGDHDGAVFAGVDALLLRISGRTETPASAEARDPGGRAGAPGDQTRRAPGILDYAVGGILAVLFLVLLITNPRLALYLLFTILSSGRGGGGGGFGGGGFSGGGGRSGGGGASGRW